MGCSYCSKGTVKVSATLVSILFKSFGYKTRSTTSTEIRNFTENKVKQSREKIT